MSGWSAYADAHNFIVAYPAGVPLIPFIPGWDWGQGSPDVAFIRLMFQRRHVYEHNGGEVDQKYLDDSEMRRSD